MAWKILANETLGEALDSNLMETEDMVLNAWVGGIDCVGSFSAEL
jgi:hypothetical protein